MKHAKLLSILLVCLPISLSVLSNENYHHQKDSLLRVAAASKGEEKLAAYESLNKLLFSDNGDVEAALSIYEAWENEALRQHKINSAGLVKVMIINYLSNRSRYGQMLERADDDLDFLWQNKLLSYYYSVYATVIEAYFNSGETEKALTEAQNLYLRSKQSEDSEGIQVALYTIAGLYGKLWRWKEAREYFKKSIDEANKSNLLNLTKLISYHHLVQLSLNLKEKERVEHIFTEWEKDVKAYELLYGKGIQLTLYAAQLSYYGEIGDLEKVEYYCNLIENAEYEHEKTGLVSYYWRVDLCMQRNDWKKALEYAEEGYRIAVEQQQSQMPLAFLIYKAQILTHLDRQEEGDELWGLIFGNTDSIDFVKLYTQLQQLYAQHNAGKDNTEKKRNNSKYSLFVFGECMLLMIVSGVWIYLNRQNTKKNKVLEKQMKELKAQHEKTATEFLNKTNFEINDVDNEFYPESRKEQLCLSIRDIVLNEKGYRDPALTRDGLIERLGTNKELFIDAFQHCFGMSFSEYINHHRLKDGIALLEETDLTIEEISEKAGFGSVRTFQRQFQTNYNMSPTDYRNSVTK